MYTIEIKYLEFISALKEIQFISTDNAYVHGR